jgi:broad specificity phosphatase PhoE
MDIPVLSLFGAVTAALLARHLRRTRLASKNSCKQNGRVSLFIIRHGERHDHSDPEWAHCATRGHDSPLSAVGIGEARDCGQHLLEKTVCSQQTVVYSSPLVRCVQTAKYILMNNFPADIKIQLETGLSEDEEYLRPRMLGIQRRSAYRLDPYGEQRRTCHPVLLASRDLQVHASPVELMHGNASICPIMYDADGHEFSAKSKERWTCKERIEDFCTHFVASINDDYRKDFSEGDGVNIVMVTHGSCWKYLVGFLCGKSEEFARHRPTYTETIHLKAHQDNGSLIAKGGWTIASHWVLPRLQGASYVPLA